MNFGRGCSLTHNILQLFSWSWGMRAWPQKKQGTRFKACSKKENVSPPMSTSLLTESIRPHDLHVWLVSCVFPDCFSSCASLLPPVFWLPRLPASVSSCLVGTSRGLQAASLNSESASLLILLSCALPASLQGSSTNRSGHPLAGSPGEPSTVLRVWLWEPGHPAEIQALPRSGYEGLASLLS